MLIQGTVRIKEATSKEILVIDENLKIDDLYINPLEYEDKGQSMRIKVKVKDEMLPHFSIQVVK
jgi:hypothetical protein